MGSSPFADFLLISFLCDAFVTVFLQAQNIFHRKYTLLSYNPFRSDYRSQRKSIPIESGMFDFYFIYFRSIENTVRPRNFIFPDGKIPNSLSLVSPSFQASYLEFSIIPSAMEIAVPLGASFL